MTAFHDRFDDFPALHASIARVRKHRQAQRQVRQAKSKKENRYLVKVMRLNKEGGAVPLVRENQGCTEPFHWAVNNLSIFILILSCK